MNDLVTDKQDTIYALAASPDFAADLRCYAAQQSGLHVSDDGGLTWRAAFESLDVPTTPPATAVALSPGGQVFAGISGGILTSTDEGRHWTSVALPAPPPFVTAFALSPDFANDGLLLAGTLDDGVFRSDNGGKSWHAWNVGLLDPHILCIALSPDFSRDKRVYVGTETGIYDSRNQGRSWQEINFPAEFSPVLSLALSHSFASDGIMWVGTEKQGLFCSEDYGQSWQHYSLTGSVNAIVLSNNPEMLVWIDDRLLLSRDGGQGWVALDRSSTASGRIIAIAAPIGNSVLLLGTEEGVITRFMLR